jgi:hypothetical protein
LLTPLGNGPATFWLVAQCLNQLCNHVLPVSSLIHINYLFSAEEWVRAINDQNLHIEEAYIYHRTKYVCHRHFATHQFNTPARLRLNRGALPTLFLTSDDTENRPSEPEIHEVLSPVRLVIGIMICVILWCYILQCEHFEAVNMFISMRNWYKPF